jgi:A/G-specific adenine glycosylase
MEPAIFRKTLLNWNRQKNLRQMPWKGEKDPYKIWLSEIILQQTRVDQGLRYYNSFITEFPDVGQLAMAEDERVFKLWEGLGYYSRCKNLLATARFIHFEKGGRFPESYEDILALKGVGPYTAAAIASFAFSLPYAVVDGNVYRVLARIFGISIPSDSTEGKKQFAQLAQQLLDVRQPAAANQAMMDFGAAVCKPQNPACGHCPFSKYCIAFKTGMVQQLPVKEKTLRIRRRWLCCLVCGYDGKLYIRKRPPGDVWENLHEFLCAEAAGYKAVFEKSAAGQRRYRAF